MDYSLVQERNYIDTFPGGDYHFELEENLSGCVPAAVRERWNRFKPYTLSEEQYAIVEAFKADKYKVNF